MLVNLRIRNFALIEEQEIQFAEGLNVLSGETGSGKSMVLHAIEIALGSRSGVHLIREGAEELEVEALFDLTKLAQSTRDALPEIAHGEELVLQRTLSRTGRGKVMINGRLGTLALLETITRHLINICGQGQHLQMLDPGSHRALIDSFADLGDQVSRYREVFHSWRQKAELVERLSRDAAQIALRRTELEGVVAEISAAAIEAGVRDRLENEVKRLSNAEGILSRGDEVLALLESEGGVVEQVGKIATLVTEMGRLDSSMAPLADLFASARTELKEFEIDLRAHVARTAVDDEGLATARDKLAEVARLERKYKCNDEGLVHLAARAQAELEMLGHGVSLEQLDNEAVQLEKEARAMAGELSGARKKAGDRLAKAVVQELADVSMKGANLGVKVEEAELGPFGSDKIEILLSTNRGEPLKALRQVASGGELARILLVLKKVLRDRTGVNVLVFDEVDVGISGAVARAVGEKLRQLASHSQVICITHLAQVASLADHHFLVDKRLGKRTVSVIREISEEERIEEIARMLAGYTVTAASRESARELIASIDPKK